MAELAYALALGASARKGLWVQIPPSAPVVTCLELGIWSDFAEAKIALSIFSKPFPPTAEAVNSQSSPQLKS